ncbi:MAG TPA: hypothetical protein VMU71_05720 [Terracidiphilus sp.]|nr:hypothetical protein [Terracidiphilus sp.]
MPSTRSRKLVFCLALLMLILPICCRAQAALLMEEPYGFFGTLNPTGHTAIYFARICAETPVKLRPCQPGELGSVIARYQGIAGYDWVAMPLIPYLYSVENPAEVPDRVNKATVIRLRNHYHEQHMGDLGAHVFEGNLVHGGWTQLVGVAYERRIFAFRFETTLEQDDALMTMLNDRANRSHFNLIYSNCADFARTIMNEYFPRTFRRTIFPDAGMTTPRQITYKLVKYARKHPGTDLDVFEIPQVPGYRRMSHANKSVAASLVTTVYAVPLTLVNPYLAGAIFVDYLVRGRYPLIPAHPDVLEPERLSVLTYGDDPKQNSVTAGIQTGLATNAPGAGIGGAESPEMKENRDEYKYTQFPQTL